MLRRAFHSITPGQAQAGLRTVATAKGIKFGEFGEPTKVLQLCENEIKEPAEDEVVVKMLMSPINPADINTIQGKYPVKPTFPALGGNEGVAEVVEVGCAVAKVKAGDRVIPFATGLGTWATYAKYRERDVMKIPKTIGNPEAATLTVNPPTAYRMLKDFVCLKPGDTVIQNGANSAVGQAVHQLCKAWGIKSVGVVRKRPNIDELRDYLKCLGATEIFTEEEIRSTKVFQTKLKKPALGLNCVGGKSATEITRHLANKGTLVTYGGMSKEPVTISTASLIFKDISFRGFWMTRWTKEQFESPERVQMLEDIIRMVECATLKGPSYELVPFTDFKRAMDLSLKGLTGKKYILDFTCT